MRWCHQDGPFIALLFKCASRSSWLCPSFHGWTWSDGHRCVRLVPWPRVFMAVQAQLPSSRFSVPLRLSLFRRRVLETAATNTSVPFSTVLPPLLQRVFHGFIGRQHAKQGVTDSHYLTFDIRLSRQRQAIRTSTLSVL